MRWIFIGGLVLLLGVGFVGMIVATTPKPKPTPTSYVGGLYLHAINTLHDNYETRGHRKAYDTARPGLSKDSAATQIATDFETLLTSLDVIPFPPSAKDDLSAFRKSVVARQVFWSEVGISGSYDVGTDKSTGESLSQAGILLGHDVGVTLRSVTLVG